MIARFVGGSRDGQTHEVNDCPYLLHVDDFRFVTVEVDEDGEVTVPPRPALVTTEVYRRSVAHVRDEHGNDTGKREATYTLQGTEART